MATHDLDALTPRRKVADLLLFLLPLTTVLGERAAFRLAGVPFYWFELGIILLGLLLWPELRVGGIKRLRALPKLVRWGTVLLVIGLLISTAVAGQHQEALGAVKSWFLFPMVLAGIVLAAGVPLKSLLYGVIAQALLQTALGFQRLPLQEESRLLGTFTSANFYAAAVVPALFLSLSLPRQFRWLPVICLGFGVLWSQSLGGMLGLLAGGLYIGLTALKQPKVRAVLVLILLIVASVGGYLAFERFSRNSRSSLAARKEIWQVAWRIGKQHPITGVGLRNFDNEYLTNVSYITTDPVEWNVPEPHNLYLAFWLDLSIIGAIGLMLLLGAGLLPAGLLATPFVVLLVHGLVDTPIFKLELALLFWCYLALALSKRSGARSDLVV